MGPPPAWELREMRKGAAAEISRQGASLSTCSSDQAGARLASVDAPGMLGSDRRDGAIIGCYIRELKNDV